MNPLQTQETKRHWLLWKESQPKWHGFFALDTDLFIEKTLVFDILGPIQRILCNVCVAYWCT